MRSVGVFYATKEGHTRQIAEHIAAELSRRGVAVEAMNVKGLPADFQIAKYNAVVLAASVHVGSHEPEMIAFVKSNRAQLDNMTHAFLSVTLSEAGAERKTSTPEERSRYAADVQKVIDAFVAETGWQPKYVKPVAGALLYTQYNFLVRFVMKRIAKHEHADTDTSKDYDYTDWQDLDRFAERLAEELYSS